MSKKDSGSSKTEHVPGPPIISPLEKDGSKTTGFGSSAEESQKNASSKRK